MNKILLNTIQLDEDIVIKKEGGVKINNQSKSVDITENGSVSVTPDAGYTGLSKVDISVSVASEGDIAETDEGVCTSFYNAGLCANPNYITKAEAALITDEDLETFSFKPTSIKSFNGFQYFIKITKLKASLFYYQRMMKSIELPPSLVEIGGLCFYACEKLESIKLPNSLNKIGAQAFIYCKRLKTITSLSYIAPTVDNSSFGINTDEYVGRNTYNINENTLIVPAGATGYDTGVWLDPLQSTDKCGFTIKYQGVNNQDKAIDIIENGTTEIVADSGYTGLGKVSVNVNVASSGGGSVEPPKDGKTRLFITVDQEEKKQVQIVFQQNIANGINIDWGDGSPSETSNETLNFDIVMVHEYATVGEYVITIDVASSCNAGIGHKSSSLNAFMNDISISRKLHKLIIGNRININGYAFSSCYALKNVEILNEDIIINQYSFSQCYSLGNITLPNTMYSNISNGAFSYCYSFVNISIPDGIVTITNTLFRNCTNLESVIFPPTIEGIDSNAFQNCKKLKTLDFSRLLSVPTLEQLSFTSASSDFKVIIPDALYDEWIAATNWSTYASNIIKKSDWDASQA